MLELRAGDAHVDGLGFDALVLGLGLGDVNFSRYPTVEAQLGELEIVEVGGDGGIEQLLLRIEATELEVVDGKFGAEAQLDVGEIGSAGLGIGARLFDGAADLSPKIGLPENLTGKGVGVIGQALGGARLIVGGALARDGGSGVERGIVARPRYTHLLARLEILLCRGLESLVRDG